MSRRHQEIIHKKAVDLLRGDVLPARGHVGVTVDRSLAVDRRRWLVVALRHVHLGWLTFGAAPIRIHMIVHTQDGRRRRYRGNTRVALLSPTAGPVLVASHPKTTYEAARRIAELTGS